jgi:hypothetical protein
MAGQGKTGRKPRLPPAAQKCWLAVRRNIHAQTISLSGASTRSIARWRSVLPLVRSQVTQKSGEVYALSEGFFSLFLEHLRKVVVQHSGNSQMTRGDFIVMALLRAALPFDKYKALTREDRLPEELKRLAGFPLRKKLTFEYGGMSPHKTEASLQTLKGRVQMLAFCGRGRRAPKILYLRLRGDPVITLTKEFFPPTSIPKSRRDREEARQFFDAVSGNLGKMLGVIQPKKGRPSESLFHQADYFHKTLGYSWRQIGALLCSEEHQHSRECGERFRQGSLKLKRK